MKAKFVTDGNWEDSRRRTVRATMDSDKIINEKFLSRAVDYFKSQVPYVDDIEDFEHFYIDGKMYDSNFWSR
jgi:hypothetical protein